MQSMAKAKGHPPLEGKMNSCSSVCFETAGYGELLLRDGMPQQLGQERERVTDSLD